MSDRYTQALVAVADMAMAALLVGIGTRDEEIRPVLDRMRGTEVARGPDAVITQARAALAAHRAAAPNPEETA